MILAIVFAWLGYKKASASGRSGILWALIAGGTFVGTQLVVGFGLGIVIGVFAALNHWNTNAADVYYIPLTILSVIASIFTGWLVLRYLDRVPEDNTSFISPPPPPKF